MDAANQFTIPADFAAGREVMDRLVAELSRRQCSPHAVFAVRLGVEESLLDIVKRGMRSDHPRDAYIRVTLALNQAEIRIVEDGVDAAKVIDLQDGA